MKNLYRCMKNVPLVAFHSYAETYYRMNSVHIERYVLVIRH